MEILFGNECDINGWMRLIRKVSGSFPGLETEEALAEHRRTVDECGQAHYRHDLVQEFVLEQ